MPEPDERDPLRVGAACPDCGRPNTEHELVRTTDADGREVCRYRCPGEA